MEQDYSKREIDGKFEAVHERFDEQDKVLVKILSNAEYTNGKVRKITIVLVLLGGVLVGILGKDVVVPVLLKLI